MQIKCCYRGNSAKDPMDFVIYWFFFYIRFLWYQPVIDGERFNVAIGQPDLYFIVHWVQGRVVLHVS